MPVIPKNSKKKPVDGFLIPQQALRITELAMHLVQGSSRTEQLYWDKQLHALVQQCFSNNKDETLLIALDSLWENQPKAYEYLADFIEDCIQTTSSDSLNSLLIAIPIMAWSRHQLPLGKIDPQLLEALKTALYEHCLTPEAQCNLGTTLYAPDSLPEGFGKTAKLAKKYFEAALAQKTVPYSKGGQLQVDMYLLADNRYLLATLSAPPGAPLFRWQLPESDATQQMLAWSNAAQTVFHDLFLGSAYTVLPPAGYFSACRHAEKNIRPFSLQAAVMMVLTSLDIEPDELRIAVGACWTHRLEEYRVSIMTRQSDTVLQGVCWPLLGEEEEPDAVLADILALLTSLDIKRVKVVNERLSLEYCDDCASPLYPDMNAEMVHTSAPDEDQHDHNKLVVH